MSKITTSAEYLPPLPLQLGRKVFVDLELATGYPLKSHLRRRINWAATSFLEDLCRFEAQSPVNAVSKRLQMLAELSVEFDRGIADLMCEDDREGDVMMSLLRPQMKLVFPKGRVSPERLREQVQGTIIAARLLEENIGKTYDSSPGRPIDWPLNSLVFRLTEIHIAAGGRVSSAYQDTQGIRNTPFLRFVSGVACAVRDVLPAGLENRQRVVRSLHDRALAARVHKLKSKGLLPKRSKK